MSQESSDITYNVEWQGPGVRKCRCERPCARVQAAGGQGSSLSLCVLKKSRRFNPALLETGADRPSAAPCATHGQCLSMPMIFTSETPPDRFPHPRKCFDSF